MSAIRKVYGIVFILLLSSIKGYSQEPSYRCFDVSNGLPSSQVYDIIQDDWGYLWFTTDRGLCRYNGLKFEHFSANDGLTDNCVFEFHKDPFSSAIWCTCYNNTLFKIVGKKPRFIPYEYNHLLPPSRAVTLNHIFIDSANNFYFQFINSTNFLKINKQGEILSNIYYGTTDPTSDSIRYVYMVGDNDIFSTVIESSANCTIPGVSFLTIENKQKYRPRTKERAEMIYLKKHNVFITNSNNYVYIVSRTGETKEIRLDGEIIHIGSLDNNTFWVSTDSDGLYEFDHSGKIIDNYLKGKFTVRMYEDHEGNKWITTLYKGVYKIRNNRVESRQINPRHDFVSAIRKDKKNDLWICYQNGDIYKYTSGTTQLIHEAKYSWPSRIDINQSTGEIFFESDFKTFIALNKTPIAQSSLMGLSSYRKNSTTYIISYCSLGFRTINLRTKEIRKFEGTRANNSLYYKNKLFVVGHDGLYYVDNDSIMLFDGTLEILNSRLDDIKLFGSSIALASIGEGIVIYDNGKIINIKKSNGLSSNFVRSIYVENDTILWSCTNRGINRICFRNLNEYSIDIMSYEDGLPSNDVTELCILNDTVWAGTSMDVCAFHKDLIIRPKRSYERYHQISQILVNDKIVSNKHLSSLKHDQNRLEIQYSAISFDDVDPIEYRYRLRGLENKWTYTTNRSAIYAKIPPGNYIFDLQVKGFDGGWENEKITLPITISPPFWQTAWFKFVAIILSVLLIYSVFYFRILTYNRDIVREILRQILKIIRPKTLYIVVKESGKDVRIVTREILYIKAEGNYLAIHTEKGKILIREKISNFLSIVPDPLEFIQIRRTHIVRIDKINRKSKKHVFVEDFKIPVGETYIHELKNIQL